MTYTELGSGSGKTLLLLPGTCCNWETNFASVLDALAATYHLVCVNYDGFDGSGAIFPDMLTVTQKIERHIQEHFGGRVDGAIGSSLGGSFVGQLIQRRNIHIDHGIMGSCDFDQSGRLAAKLQTKLVYPFLAGAARNDKKQEKMKKLLKNFFLMNEETAARFMRCFASFSPESILNEYYTDLITPLEDAISVPHTKVHIIYALKMGKKYARRYRKYFLDPDIREFDMQHEQWLFGEARFAEPVLRAIDEWMEQPV